MVKLRLPDQAAPQEPAKARARLPGLPGENGDISALLRQAAGAQRLIEERLLADLGVTPPQLAIMTLIGATPGLLAADLARASKLTPQTVSLVVANLRRAELVREEESAVATATRARPLALTPKGESALRMGRERVEAASARLVEGMRGKRERGLRRWLAAIAAGLPTPGALLDAED